MNVIESHLAGLKIIEPKSFGDSRGYFFESYQKKRYAEAGISAEFIQDNVSRSAKGVLRGLHYQLKKPQGKLVTVTRGSVFDVAVDIRKNSPTFGEWIGEILSDENHKQLYVPPGFAHGFVVLSDIADFHYKCTDYYDAADEAGIAWNDDTINVDWPLVGEPIMSGKDLKNPMLKYISEDLLP